LALNRPSVPPPGVSAYRGSAEACVRGAGPPGRRRSVANDPKLKYFRPSSTLIFDKPLERRMPDHPIIGKFVIVNLSIEARAQPIRQLLSEVRSLGGRSLAALSSAPGVPTSSGRGGPGLERGARIRPAHAAVRSESGWLLPGKVIMTSGPDMFRCAADFVGKNSQRCKGRRHSGRAPDQI
jgi:hypothetical protein